jgi:glycosyltransferase involved in cell wall biosynthesis
VSPTLHWLSPGDPNQKTGGFIYNLRVIEAMRSAGREVVLHCLEGDWPFPDEATIERVAMQLQAIPVGEPLVADGLLWPGLGQARTPVLAQHAVLVLVHSLIDMEAGDDTTRTIQEELAGIREADAWIATSQRTAALVRRRVGSQSMGAVAIPGCDPAPRSRGSGGTRLLCVATITRRKGHAGLLEALASIVHLDWTLDCAGATDREPECTRALLATIDKLGLRGRVNLLGGLSGDALEAAYTRADVLVHGASFEGFGMGLAEALIRGIPVVSTPAGCLDDVSASAAVVVESGAWVAFGAAVGRLLEDAEHRRAMSNAARALPWPTWSDVAARIGDEVDRMGATR